MAWTGDCRAYSVIGWIRKSQHYKRLLASETDETKRKSIARLLAEEEAKLAKISKERKRI